MANNSLDSLAPLILNPLTPMAFLPPQFGFELTLLKYVFVGTLGVSRAFYTDPPVETVRTDLALRTVKAVIFDTIMCIGVDYRLLRDFKITLPTVVYFFSRWVPPRYHTCE